MKAALSYVHQSIPRNEVILLDYQSSVTIGYYLCTWEEMRQFSPTEQEFVPLNCDGRSFLAMNYRTWVLNEKNFPSKFEKLARQYGLRSGTRVWVFQTGPTASLDTDIQN